jgi:ADP-ribosylation factor-binding protein GGA
MCEEDSEDHEAVAKLFEINDSIHRTIERYKLFKKGDIEAANQIPQGTLGRSGAGVSQGPNNTLNLIDFGDPEPAPVAKQSTEAPQQSASTGHALEDDLLGLSLGGDSYGQPGSISLGGSNGSGKSPAMGLYDILTVPTVLGLSGVPVPQSQSQQKKTSAQQINDLFASTQTPTPPPAQSAFSQPSVQPARSPDPFAALASTPRQGSPFQYQQSIKQPSSASATVDLLGGAIVAPTSNLAQSSTSAANDDDEWTFASSVPDTSNEITVTNTTINVLFNVSRETDTTLLINSRISNNTPIPIGNLTLQVAASKVSKIATARDRSVLTRTGRTIAIAATIWCQPWSKSEARYHTGNQSQ